MKFKKGDTGEYGSCASLVPNMSKNEEYNEENLDLANVPEAPEERVLTPDEKSFLLCVERGDVASAKSIIEALSKRPQIFDVNCVDPLGRSALIISVENENIDMIEMLLSMKIKPKDALLVSIREEYVDGVELLLKYEEEFHNEGEPYSWELLDNCTANFTIDITPVILAAHRNNYEILKLLLDRGATIPLPHDVKCSCDECVRGSMEDSLRFSLARINAYKALAAPSLIALSAKDPILTAFQLSDELKRLAKAESQYREEYIKLRKQVQDFVTGLIDHTRTSFELEVILNHNPEGDPWQVGDIQSLERLKLSLSYKQKAFVAHPSVQQLLASIWYEGLPGFRRKHIVRQILEVLKLSCTFPINSLLYILAPHSEKGRFMRNPFVKFISHSSSYMFFLMLLALASQRVEYMALSFLCFLFPEVEFLSVTKYNWEKYERGSIPNPIELLVILWVQGYLWMELKSLWQTGLINYLKNLWNLADLFCIGAFMNWIGLRAVAFLIVQKEKWDGVDPEEIWKPREEWNTFEPMLLADAMFGAGMIASYLKVVHVFSINPYLGPLQIAIGKMIIDIVKFLFLYCLVVFAFGCGMNQLLWYYADLEKQECYQLPGGKPDFENEPESCTTWRRFANLWETSQSLFWASFGLLELGDFDLKGIGEFTRFWGLLMFGSYSVCNIIVLLNMLIAMMSNSYQIIFERSDTEWKFSRSKLWISYFDFGSTVPVPFNLIPSPKAIIKILCCRKHEERSFTDKDREDAETRYTNVMKYIIRRYITNEQRKSEDFSITEDDINEVRQDINSFKFELLDILKKNNWNVPNTKKSSGVIGKKSKNMERQIQKGFQITKIEGIMEAFAGQDSLKLKDVKPKDLFKRIAKAAVSKDTKKDIRNRESLRRTSAKRDPIGSIQNSLKRHETSLKRSMLRRGSSQVEIKMMLTRLNSEELVAFNPLLLEHTPATRRAYAMFKSALVNYNEKYDNPPRKEDQLTEERNLRNARTARDSIRKLIRDKPNTTETLTEQDCNKKINNDTSTQHQPSKVPDQANEEKETSTLNKDISKVKEVEKARVDVKVEEKCETAKEGIIVKTNKPAGASQEAAVNDELGDIVVKVRITPPSVHNTLDTEDKNMEKEKSTETSQKGEKGASISKEKSSPARLSEKETPKTSPIVPEEEYQFDPEGKSAISGQKRTGWL